MLNFDPKPCVNISDVPIVYQLEIVILSIGCIEIFNESSLLGVHSYLRVDSIGIVISSEANCIKSLSID